MCLTTFLLLKHIYFNMSKNYLFGFSSKSSLLPNTSFFKNNQLKVQILNFPLRWFNTSCSGCRLCLPTVKLFPVTCEYINGEKQFYYRAQQFYEDVPASEEGMMGDFVEISNVDLEASRQFLKRFVVSGEPTGSVACL